jgi:hypothetical protein
VELFASMDDGDVVSMSVDLDTPPSKREEFELNYRNPAQRKEAYLDYYVHNHPILSWTKIAKVLQSHSLHLEAAMIENTYIQGMPLSSYIVPL